MAADKLLVEELKWILERDMPNLIGLLDLSMTQCESIVSQNMANPAGSGQQKAILLQSSLHVDVIKGHLFVKGDSITKAEITLRLPTRAGHKVAKTSIREHDAFRLVQIQDACNYFLKAFQKHKAVLYRLTDLKNPQSIVQVIGEIQQVLLMAVSSLKNPKLRTIADIHAHSVRKVLKPSLPEDILLDIHVKESNVVMTMLQLTSWTKNSMHGQSSNSESVLLGNYVGSCLQLSSQVHEVASQYQIQSVIPWLDDVLKDMKKGIRICQEIIDKLNTFRCIVLPQKE